MNQYTRDDIRDGMDPDTIFTEKCDLCGRKIDRQEGPALCPTCEGSCRAHARAEKHRIEQIEMDGDYGKFL